MKKFIKRWAAPLLCGLFFFLLFRFVFFIGCVTSISMEPTVKEGSFFCGARIFGEIQRDDILAFERRGKVVVKRVAAVPGDTVYIDDTRLTFSVGDELPEFTRELIVPDECYFMVGDNTERSYDSRRWDMPFITRSQIIAKRISFTRGGK